MTPGARPCDRENPGRANTMEKLVRQAGGGEGKMQQSRAGSQVTGNPFNKVWMA